MDASVIYKRHESEDKRPVTARILDEAASEVASITDSIVSKEETAVRDEKDKERWAKLKRLKQAFHVKRRKGKESAEVVRTGVRSART